MAFLWERDANGVYVDIFQTFPEDPLDVVRQNERITTKNNEMSTNYRMEGHNCFIENKFWSAIELYNKSLCLAENDSVDNGLAYVNRSRCFLHVRRYDECLLDISLAMNNHFPLQCAKYLEEHIDYTTSMIQKYGGLTRVEELVKKLDFPACENYPGMANVLSIKRNAQSGRHIVANSKISVGKMVLFEKPFLMQGGIYETCAICCANTSNFFPCANCNKALFCFSCENGTSSHRLFCGNALDENDQIWLRCLSIAFEMFPTAAGLMEFVENALTEPENAREPPQQLIDTASKYREFLRLWVPVISPSHIQLLLRETSRVYHYILRQNAVSEIFSTERERRFLMHLLMHHRVVFLSNSYGEDGLGRIYIKTSYFNHSCVPNVLLTRIGRVQTAFTLRPINEGDELFVAYSSDDFEEQSALQQFLQTYYGFQCNCEKCTSDPSDYAREYVGSNDQDYQYVTNHCRQNFRNPEEAMMLRTKCINVLTKYSARPWNREMQLVAKTFGYATLYLQAC